VSDILAARAQMAVSLGFHIIFAVLGIGMPLLMAIAVRVPFPGVQVSGPARDGRIPV